MTRTSGENPGPFVLSSTPRVAALRSILMLAAAALLLTGVPTADARAPLPPDRVEPLPGTGPAPARPATLGCAIGETGIAAYVVDDIAPPDDAYHVRVRGSECADCSGSSGVWVSAVHVMLEFRMPCGQPVEVAVVGPTTDLDCAPPDGQRTLRAPVAQLLEAATPGVHEFVVSLGGPVALGRDNYLRIRFTADGAGCTDPGTRPRLVTDASPIPCVGWNEREGVLTDLTGLAYPGEPLLWAVADSCLSAAVTGVGAGGPAALGLRVSPNPMRSDALVEWARPLTGDATFEVRDVLGRLVRRAPVGGPAGSSWRWDGLDDEGRRVRPGLYLVTLRTAATRETRRVVVER